MRSRRGRQLGIMGIGIATLAVVLGALLLANRPGSAAIVAGRQAPVGTVALAVITPSPPTPAVGARITLPDGITRPDAPEVEIALVVAGQPPLIAQREAMQAVADTGVPWGLGGQYAGKAVTVTAWYGLGTVGRPGDAGKPWVGRRNIPLKDGTILDHIKTRAMWVIDYGNTVAYGAGAPSKPAPTYDHTVYLVDAQTRTVLEVRFYQGA